MPVVMIGLVTEVSPRSYTNKKTGEEVPVVDVYVACGGRDVQNISMSPAQQAEASPQAGKIFGAVVGIRQFGDFTTYQYDRSLDPKLIARLQEVASGG